MAMNRIPCQPGLSLPAFHQPFGTEAQCAAALERARWPAGFRCPQGGHTHAYIRHVGAQDRSVPGVSDANLADRGYPVSEHPVALTLWLLTLYLISQAQTGLSTLALQRQWGVSYPTAWLIQHQLMPAMVERESA